MSPEPPLEPPPHPHGEARVEVSPVTTFPAPRGELPAFAEGFRVEGPGFVLAWGAGADDAHSPLSPGQLPRLREQTAYPVLLRSVGGLPVALEHRDPVLLRGMRSGDGGRVAWGAVDFGGQVGRSAFRVRVGPDEAARFEVEVVPTKLDYESDFAALVHDTGEITAALVLEWLRATTHPGAPALAERPARIEWLLLLRRAADELEAALAHIVREPRHALRREGGEAVRAEQVRRPDAALRRAVLRGAGSGGALPLEGGAAVRERVDERRPRATADTPEHRWLAAQLRAARRGVERLLAAERGRPPSPRGDRTVDELEALAERVGRLERAGPLASVTGEPPASFASLLLLHAPGYREAHRACLLLLRGVHPGGGPAELSLRDLHLLYEQWCWLALVRALARVTGSPLPARALLAESGEGLRVRLRRGWEGSLAFPLAGGGSATLVPQPRFGGEGLLVPQRPDALLEVRRPGRAPVRAVLDAKYRVDPSPAYAARHGAAGPPEDALNTLHRYRDALGARAAVALFPGRAEGFGETRLWAALGTLGVGALPFLPGQTAWVEEWLREMTA